MTFTFTLDWPGTLWGILKCFSGKLSTNWAWELNFYATHSIIIFDVSIKATGDHRGLFVMLGLLGYATDVNIYDVRHEGELYGSL